MSGNTPKIALKHCLQVTAEDFQQAAEFERPDGSAESSALGVNESVIEVPEDIDLRTIIDSWPLLSTSIRSEIMDLVHSEEQ